ncbi:MAG: hypothetical protein RLY93_06035 [Sumerlaeia bacterium]
MAKRARFPVYRRLPAARVVAGSRAIPDTSDCFVSVLDWLGGEGADAASSAERRAEHLLGANEGLLRDMAVRADPMRRGGVPGIRFQTAARVGAVPLLSPVTGRPDFGLVIEPRFAWASAGDMLAGMGFRVVPEFLPLPELPQSERRVPPWVLSSVILKRLEDLLNSLQRRSATSQAILSAPRGQVDWTDYATRRFARGRALDVPCRFPDLRDDEELRAAIHWVVRRHRESLLSQMNAGLVVHRLLALCDLLLSKLSGTPPRMPIERDRSAWNRRPLLPKVFREGLQAIDWTVDERGLAGLSDLSGLSWRLDMAAFFEAWVETIAESVARQVGATLRSGRRQQTRVPMDWLPPSSGSQRSLLPDVVLEREDVVVVLDAKYKRHAEDIERLGWSNADEALREQHRNDVLQALAYSTLFNAPRVVSCLVYPIAPEKWAELRRRGRTLHRAQVRTGERHVEMALLSVPLSGDPLGAGEDLKQLVRRGLSEI